MSRLMPVRSQELDGKVGEAAYAVGAVGELARRFCQRDPLGQRRSDRVRGSSGDEHRQRRRKYDRVTVARHTGMADRSEWRPPTGGARGGKRAGPPTYSRRDGGHAAARAQWRRRTGWRWQTI